jgi:leucyl aminopeptidase
MEYRGGTKEDQTIVLVGKGLVFDSGGLCLKPWQSMSSMKMDMGGAASIFGTMQAIIRLKLPINVVGVVALVENSLDGNSYRPGDVLTSMKGITVEIGNTDAEGRLVLCDTLTYIERYKPKVVIDVATLTGAMVVALGGDLTGLFANDDTLANELKLASEESHDPAWQMPLHAPYHELLKSDVADMNNIGGPAAGSITAALFLSKFTENYTWAHLDVACSAMTAFEKATATGRPVPMLTQYLINQVK